MRCLSRPIVAPQETQFIYLSQTQTQMKSFILFVTSECNVIGINVDRREEKQRDRIIPLHSYKINVGYIEFISIFL